jgi:glycyl-radical enzyme activating protein
MSLEEKGLIFNIQRFSTHDGPGIRTTVFLKGCTLKCFWCHNPESIAPKPEIMWQKEKCIGCNSCVFICPCGAQTISNGIRVFNRKLCTGCGLAEKFCPTKAIKLEGYTVSVSEVISEVERDRAYYDSTGGGITLSGGEPLMQPEFALSILEEAFKRSIHTVVDTAGNVPFSVMERAARFTKLFLFDIKHLNADAHKQGTGVSSNIILENLHILLQMGAAVIIRIPVIPGFNDSLEHMSAVADFISKLRPVEGVEIMPFHRMGEAKYESLDLENKIAQLSQPSDNEIEQLLKLFLSFGLKARCG